MGVGAVTSEQSVDGTEDAGREARSAIANAIHHLETIESSLEPFDQRKNREARRKLESSLKTLEDREVQPGTDQNGVDSDGK
jgi:hypothetical protein